MSTKHTCIKSHKTLILISLGIYIAVHTLTRNQTVKTGIFKFCLQPIIPAEKGRETWISDWHCCYLCYWWSFCSHLDYDISVPRFTHSWDYPLKAKRVLMAGHHSVYFYP